MQGYQKQPRNTKSKFRIVAGGAGTDKPKPLRAGGPEPTEEMLPGEYLLHCEGATTTKKGEFIIAVLRFKVLEPIEHLGIALTQWIQVPEVGGVVPLGSRYAKQGVLALHREVDAGDDLDPQIFVGQTFVGFVGFRKTPGRGGQASDDNALTKKGATDFLRVHSLFGVQDE